MAHWRQSEPKVWNYRISGKSSDGTTVTLGRYDTEQQAKTDYENWLKEGFYRNLKIQPVKPSAVAKAPPE